MEAEKTRESTDGRLLDFAVKATAVYFGFLFVLFHGQTPDLQRRALLTFGLFFILGGFDAVGGQHR